MAMRFPLTVLLNEQECYSFLMYTLHPNGLKCPNGHPLPPEQAPHDRGRAPIMNYRCRQCGRVFNVFTDTVWAGTHYDARTIVMVIRGFAQGTTTFQLAEELHLDYGTLLDRRHTIQAWALKHKPSTALPDRDRSR